MTLRAFASAGVLIALVDGAGCTKPTDAREDAEADPAATSSPSSSAAPPQPRTLASAEGSDRKAARVAPPTAALPPPASSNEGAKRPLAAWMRGPATDAFNSGDLESIAQSFERMSAWAPPGYANWASISRDGSDAARAGNMEAVKAACRGCHAQYRAQYAATFATRPLS